MCLEQVACAAWRKAVKKTTSHSISGISLRTSEPLACSALSRDLDDITSLPQCFIEGTCVSAVVA